MRIPDELISLIRNEESFLLATHVNPDGDAIGSSLALSDALISIGKKVRVYDRDPLPEIYNFMPGHERFVLFPGDLADGALVLLDCNSPERAGLDGRDFRSSAVIDHHETESAFGRVRWIEPEAAATGLMVYNLIKALGIKITKSMAVNLYTAISVDTGTFRFSNTTAEVLRASAELVEAGAEPHSIAANLYDQWDLPRFELLVAALNNLEIRDGIAMMHITDEMFRKTGTSQDDTENFSNFPRMINAVKISAMIRRSDDAWKVSLRSKGDFNVARIAEIYGGGGHRNAAGYKVKGDLEYIKESLFENCRKLI